MRVLNLPTPELNCLVTFNGVTKWVTKEEADNIWHSETQRIVEQTLGYKLEREKEKQEKSKKEAQPKLQPPPPQPSLPDKDDDTARVARSFGDNLVEYGKFAVWLGVEEDKIDKYLRFDSTGRTRMTISNILRSKVRKGLDINAKYQEWQVNKPT